LRAVGFISVFFWLFILFCMGIIIKYFISDLSSKSTPIRERLGNLPLSFIQGLFCVLFPLFFLTCLSLSPMHINPFEYWPSVGLFATFGSADAIRYRWLYILFPFYFAAIVIGMAIFLRTGRKNRFSRLMIISLFVFFIMCGIWKSIGLYSLQDFPKIFYYKGYYYDLFAHKFILGEFSPPDIKTAQFIVQNYPEAIRSEAYSFFGTLIAARTIAGKEKNLTIEETLKTTPSLYIPNVIGGIVRLANNVSEQEFQPLKLLLTQKYPDLFYKSWGFQYLVYKYYGLLVNKKILFDNIPSVEQWFFSNFLNKFKQETADHNRGGNTDDLLGEIKKLPENYQGEVVRGLGMRIGALMLFDPLYTADYPLDSRFGERFPAPQREAFYEGVGSGFAETMCIYWRMLMLPDNIDSPMYEKLLDIEWNRCNDLMSRFAAPYYPIMKKGFLKNLSGRHVSPGIKHYIDNKLILEKG
jgi:hypothetical protein